MEKTEDNNENSMIGLGNRRSLSSRRAVEIMGRKPYMLPWLALAHAAAGNRAESAVVHEENRRNSKNALRFAVFDRNDLR